MNDTDNRHDVDRAKYEAEIKALKDALREAVNFINKTYKGNFDNLGKDKLIKKAEELLK